MKWTVEQWHKRFVQQAYWTASLRKYLYSQVGLQPHSRVLDIGCGTGALSDDFAQISTVTYFGGDIDHASLVFAAGHHPNSSYSCADARHLPFRSGSFDFVICHYFLLWLTDPSTALSEMARVATRGGSVLALAEPDYTARIDAPDQLIPLGKAQTDSLKVQGANPASGRHLPYLFSQAGLHKLQFGVSGFQSHLGEIPADWDLEWQVMEQDLAESFSTQEIEHLKQIDREAWLAGSRVLWVPTFYIYGTKGL